MNLNLTRPLCFFDLETTGVSVSNDRIVEIAILKLYPDESKDNKTWRVNPVSYTHLTLPTTPYV